MRPLPRVHLLVPFLFLVGVEFSATFVHLGRHLIPAKHSTRACQAAGWKAQVDDGANVAIVGASSRVGKCVAQRLMQDGRFNLKLISGSTAPPDLAAGSDRAQVYLGSMGQQDFGNGINLLELSGQQGANGQSAGQIVPASDVLSDVSAVIIADTTSTFPKGDWLVGRAPTTVDVRQVSNVVQNLGPRTQHVIFLSCMGAKRKLPLFPRLDPNILFWVLDRFGALSAKREGERIVATAGERSGFATSIVRPKLHCYESGWAGGLPQEAFAQMQYEGVQLVPGDLIDGETSDRTAAEALVQCLLQPGARDRDFCVTNTRGAAPGGQEGWDALFEGLEGLEKQLAESLG